MELRLNGTFGAKTKISVPSPDADNSDASAAPLSHQTGADRPGNRAREGLRRPPIGAAWACRPIAAKKAEVGAVFGPNRQKKECNWWLSETRPPGVAYTMRPSTTLCVPTSSYPHNVP